MTALRIVLGSTALLPLSPGHLFAQVSIPVPLHRDNESCNHDYECQNDVCHLNKCMAPTCTDLHKNGLETDIDCGGGTCQSCGNSKQCLTASDCSSGVCTGYVCQAPTYTDGVKNGDETDVDCGGLGPDCNAGQHCSVAGDCSSTVCSTGVCQAPSCTDNIKNGYETDVDCGPNLFKLRRWKGLLSDE